MHDSFHRAGRACAVSQHSARRAGFWRRRRGALRHADLRHPVSFYRRADGGRTPEYLGKKIESREVKLSMLYVLIFPLLILYYSGWSLVAPYGVSSLNNAGPHGLTEVLYAYSSAAGNNGSAFAGLNANTLWYNGSLALTMLAGRFLMIVPALAIAGSLVGKKSVPESLGTFPTNGVLFVALLVGVIIIVGALTFFPALSLGPIVEHFVAQAGKVY
jgi:K+-transporting ATPase ATPase A chain